MFTNLLMVSGSKTIVFRCILRKLIIYRPYSIWFKNSLKHGFQKLFQKRIVKNSLQKWVFKKDIETRTKNNDKITGQ